MDTITIGIIVAIVEAIKKLNKVPKEYMPFLAMIIGVVITGIYNPTLTIPEILVEGIVGGLIAVGAYEATKQAVAPVAPQAKEMWTSLLSRNSIDSSKK